MCAGLTEFEQKVMDMLLAGEDAVLSVLREQLNSAQMIHREFTGVGFLQHSLCPTTLKEFPATILFSLEMSVPTLKPCSMVRGFLLHVENGMLDFLEGFTYDEQFPEEIEDFTCLPRRDKEPRIASQEMVLTISAALVASKADLSRSNMTRHTSVLTQPRD